MIILSGAHYRRFAPKMIFHPFRVRHASLVVPRTAASAAKTTEPVMTQQACVTVLPAMPHATAQSRAAQVMVRHRIFNAPSRAMA